VTAPILAGDDFTGVSIMLMDAGVDTGPVLMQSQIPISADDTTDSLTAKLSQLSARLLQEALLSWSRGEITPRPQEQERATYAPTISRADGEIDWNLPALEIWRRIRALQPWPGCFTRWHGKQLKIIEAVPVASDEHEDVGRVVELPRQVVGVVTGAGALGLLKVQMEGKQVMSASAFLRGHRDFPGSVLTG